MCGLAGWVSYGRDLREYTRTASTMTETMVCRGPDAGGLWSSQHAVLGHRRLSIIDLEGGRQPMAVAEGSDDLPVITYTGEVYNFQELREELRGLGHEFRTSSDTEVVLRAYLQWGAGFAERLNGIYAFAIWDPRSEELLLVRDRMGVKPLYYHPTEDGVIFGSELKAILAHEDVEAVIDGEGLREIFSIVKTPGHGVLKGMYEVLPATVMRFTKDGSSSHRYWELTAREHTDDLDTTIDTVRELLEDIVDRQLIADVTVGTLLSGGLDSSAITAIAAKALAEKGVTEPIRAFSVNFTGHEERFEANVQWADPDTPYAIEVAEHVGAEHIIVELDSNDVLNDEVRQQVLRAQDLPVSTGDMEYSLLLLCRALKERMTVALSGEAADELFGGYTWFHDEEAVSLDSFPWHHPFEKAGGIGALHDIGLWDRLGLTEYIKQRYTEALQQVPRLAGETGHEARMRELTFLNLTRWENFLLDRKDRISMAASLEVRVPFTDHRLVEYVYNTPWAMKNFDGREKSLLRAAMRGVLPDSVLDRKKNPYPSTQDLTYELELRKRVEAIITEGAPVLGLVGEADIRRLLDRPEGAYAVGGPWSARAVLERLVEFNTWVSDYDVTVEL
ncbi:MULTISPECIES: asparagine synthase (glutamine-hydrolyzing) [Streptomyces]|uniref:asparagine synthase (glutamine-hydrolyzing) n=1 Tax=Streptomyces TaxID=1883 RepID=UPI0004CC772C|nr:MULTISPECIES: asparagine synthase (glutamine-hydrolyzing) [Streptomyces]NDZ68533.1 asparagine synthase (glutamine-hydrolyzing) [Streptomyces cyaneofuscatus]RDV50906.1 asparagine synthase (glutamine-hydrolyzing) [Streptomyces sp. IB2014 011-12]CAD5925135.1 Asparagine synthetase [glutamine-hydrolyzing] 3 [Streptomyces sp. KY70]CAD5990391.1 Asparagine synthetase [glutamine-hydrolyzing] 3 [Streptomyces sp. KY75]